MTAAVFRAAVYTTLRLGTVDVWSALLSIPAYAAAPFAGGFAQLVAHPLEVLKVRSQCAPPGVHPARALLSDVRARGVRVAFAGVSAAACRAAARW